MLTVENIERMSIAERLEAMELLWTSLSSTAQRDFPSQTWHGEILAARMAKVEAGEGHFLSLEELKKRLRR